VYHPFGGIVMVHVMLEWFEMSFLTLKNNEESFISNTKLTWWLSSNIQIPKLEYKAR
jgi:hypothetical protein